MSLYMMIKHGFRFWIADSPNGKRVVSRAEAEKLFRQMKAERATP
ncbi:hypothetical protein [Vibrio sp. JC009]|nr:hypothetical protein [Vibrio sp. JC009]